MGPDGRPVSRRTTAHPRLPTELETRVPLLDTVPRRAAAALAATVTSVALAGCTAGPTPDTAAAPSTSTPVPTAPPPATTAATPRAADLETAAVQIRLTVDDTVLTASLADNATAEAFVAQLPLTLVLSDYNEVEKLIELPERLPTDGAPEGIDPSPGDIAYFAPWGNLALYHGDAPYFAGIVELGRLEGGIDVLAGLPDGSPIRIERV